MVAEAKLGVSVYIYYVIGRHRTPKIEGAGYIALVLRLWEIHNVEALCGNNQKCWVTDSY